MNLEVARTPVFAIQAKFLPLLPATLALDRIYQGPLRWTSVLAAPLWQRS